MQATDKILGTAKEKFTASYGVGAFPWQSIIAALMSLLTGCVPTPANVKNQLSRPLIQLKLYRRLAQYGIPWQQIPHVAEASVKMAVEATDQELSDFIAAAQESE